jgi:hypothetical protein
VPTAMTVQSLVASVNGPCSPTMLVQLRPEGAQSAVVPGQSSMGAATHDRGSSTTVPAAASPASASQRTHPRSARPSAAQTSR